MEPSVCVSILHFRDIEDTRRCINSVLESKYSNLQVMLVDNSYSNQCKKIDTNGMNLNILSENGNLGFASGHNKVINKAKEEEFDYILCLNNDVVIPSSAILDLVNKAKNENKGSIFAPKVIQKDGENERGEVIAGHLDWFRGEPYSYGGNNHKWIPSLFKSSSQGNVDYLHGAALFGNVDIFSNLNGFNENYFLYYEDTDFSQRAKKSGIQLVPTKEIVVNHIRKETRDLPELEDAMVYFSIRNRAWFMFTHANSIHLLFFVPWYLTVFLTKAVLFGLLKKRRGRFCKYVLFGAISGITISKYKEKKVKGTLSNINK